MLQETSSEVKGVSSCVLPAWLMHCAWDEHQMLFAVNGETGKFYIRKSKARSKLEEAGV